MTLIQTALIQSLFPPEASVDYAGIAADVSGGQLDQVIEYLSEELPYIWRDAYLSFSIRKPEVSRIKMGTFEYICDDYQSQESRGNVPLDANEDSRVIAVCGRSKPLKRKRDDSRLRGWVGDTNTVFGKEWSKGHYVAHSMGGAVDQCEINVFLQRKDLNCGWSEEGKRYRLMEKYCVENPGIFCFSRPLYLDGTCRPSVLEYGVLMSNSELWVEAFDNRLESKPEPGDANNQYLTY